MPEQNPNVELPRLNDLFFAVCSTAIKNVAWKYSDFEKVKVVEGQLAALNAYFVDLYTKEAEAAAKQPATEQPTEEAGVAIELPKTTLPTAPVDKAPEAPQTLEQALSDEPAPAPVAPVTPEADQEKKNS